jgi:hypothetical protein
LFASLSYLLIFLAFSTVIIVMAGADSTFYSCLINSK